MFGIILGNPTPPLRFGVYEEDGSVSIRGDLSLLLHGRKEVQRQCLMCKEAHPDA